MREFIQAPWTPPGSAHGILKSKLLTIVTVCFTNNRPQVSSQFQMAGGKKLNLKNPKKTKKNAYAWGLCPSLKVFWKLINRLIELHSVGFTYSYYIPPLCMDAINSQRNYTIQYNILVVTLFCHIFENHE